MEHYGKGAYVSGQISLTSISSIYIYVGQYGQLSNSISCTWNGGGSGYHTNGSGYSTAGGGATDIRLTNGDWDNFNSLKSRIIVAGGGGGGCHGGFGGYGGGIEGSKGVTYAEANLPCSSYTGGDMSGLGGTQTSGGMAGGFNWNQGIAPTNGIFGTGGAGCTSYGGGGGGGWYGGGGSGVQASSMGGGGGGSSFISGHSGCNAISSTSTSTNIVHTGQPNHYSGYVFTNTVMKAGNESMPSTTGGTETGHSGNGYCKITWHPAL